MTEEQSKLVNESNAEHFLLGKFEGDFVETLKNISGLSFLEVTHSFMLANGTSQGCYKYHDGKV